MTYSVTLETYQGPLDVLLDLLYSKKLEVNDISLKGVTEQFISYVEEHAIPDDELADFMTIAARLVLLKSKSLLPYLHVEDTEEDLTDMLKMYEIYWKASFTLGTMYTVSNNLFSKSKVNISSETIFTPPASGITAQSLHDLFTNVLLHYETPTHLPRTIIKQTISLSHRIVLLKRLLNSARKLSFRTYIATGESRADIIVNFLAALELIKQNEVAIHSSGDDIILVKVT